MVSGSTVDVAGNANIAAGVVVVAHSGALWIAEEQINEVLNRYTILPLEKGLTAARFNGINGIMGDVEGALVFFDDVILMTYGSSDHRYQASEVMRQVGEARYETRGALFLERGHVSSWSYALQRA